MQPPDPDPPRTPTHDVVRPLARPFDPTSVEAEDQYDAVVRRVNRARGRRTMLSREFERLSTQFVDGEPTVQSGPRRGEPLSPQGRRRRLARLVDVAVALRKADAEEAFASDALDRMNRALDRWARETYGIQ